MKATYFSLAHFQIVSSPTDPGKVELLDQGSMIRLMMSNILRNIISGKGKQVLFPLLSSSSCFDNTPLDPQSEALMKERLRKTEWFTAPSSSQGLKGKSGAFHKVDFNFRY